MPEVGGEPETGCRLLRSGSKKTTRELFENTVGAAAAARIVS